MLIRRDFVCATLSTAVGAIAAGWAQTVAATTGLARLPAAAGKLEADLGGRIGVAVLDTTSGIIVGHRANERFPICSTFKPVAAAATLARVDAGKEQLTRPVRIEPKDILSYAPVTKSRVGGDMTVAELCEAAITVSDNTAANLLLARLGGPAALTRFARSIGDRSTRLDRIEPDLNEALPGDPRDTTTPAAMAHTIRSLTIGNALSAQSRAHLTDWLVACKTGDAKLRAGLQPGWRVGDKTGSGGHGTSNDVAIVWPTARPPAIIAAYLTGTTAPDEKRNAAFAAIGREVTAAVGFN